MINDNDLKEFKKTLTLSVSLPLYARTYDLLSELTDRVFEFPRLAKYTLGETLISLCISMLGHIKKANETHDNEVKFEEIRLYRDDLEVLRLYLRLCTEKKYFQSAKGLAQITIILEDVTRQIKGWKNSIDSKIKAARAELKIN